MVSCLRVAVLLVMLSALYVTEPKPLFSDARLEQKLQHVENGDYFEGDLALSYDMIATHYGLNAMIATTAIRDLSLHWPNGEVPYKFDDSISESARSLIKDAMNSWSSKTCITFKPHTKEQGYVTITTKYGGCFSDYVGYSGGMQTLNLQEPDCMMWGHIAHELGHHLGLWHEHTRPDRDEYVKILEKNIETVDMGNFAKRTWVEINSQGLKYDFDSIMHYSFKAFTKNGKDTIEVVNKKLYKDERSPYVGQRNHLSDGDVAVINKMYGCTGR